MHLYPVCLVSLAACVGTMVFSIQEKPWPATGCMVLGLAAIIGLACAVALLGHQGELCALRKQIAELRSELQQKTQ